ncbi:NUDIX domain-containing protein [Flavobacteriaceae bacterium]|nr:NUDIX domain-containing protein [Flavobacteriaceae bacterium]MDB4182954.1 NUDIX domain-containing protein [Flavobacteriaceae bacterium]MDC0092547.1 NUDIX domain-containing protein [bacterium]MDC0118120.1 NUDIX domain-containing protein [bacterium]MDG1394340.1 NUDIX domain-containing protein [Flavobacteriaceae bacterium]
MDEYLDIWDPDGKPTGKTCLKDEAHQKGWFHPTVHVWFYTSTPALLLQKRSLTKETYPGFWDVSVAGHVSAGESIIEGVIREVKEEIGLDILEKDLIPLDVRKNTNRFDNGIIDCEFQHVFLAKLEATVSQLTTQATEVDDVRLFSFDELQLCRLQKHTKYTIVPADMSYYQFVMDTVLKIL